MVERSDLTDEEWEALNRVNRGPPESRLVPATIAERLHRLGLTAERGGQRRVTDSGKRFLLRHRQTE